MLGLWKKRDSGRSKERESKEMGTQKKGEEEREKAQIKIDLLIHDLKVPLAVIDAGVNSLLTKREKYGPLTEAQEKTLKRILRNVKVTQTLVSDILEVGRSRAGISCKNKVGVHYLLKRVISEIMDLTEGDTSEEVLKDQPMESLISLLSPKGIHLKVDNETWSKEILLDVPKTVQIFRNLLTNALKFKKSMVEITVSIKDERFCISVKDDGEGIPEEYHEKIFKSYFQVDQSEICCVRGHGLGLAGAMILVEDMGGRLSLSSKSGQGATFIVELPLN